MQRKGSQPPPQQNRIDYTVCQDTDDGTVLTHQNTGIPTLLKYHTLTDSKQPISRKSATQQTTSIKIDKYKLAQIYVDYKSAQLRSGLYEIHLSLWAQLPGSTTYAPLTEEFTVSHPPPPGVRGLDYLKKSAVFKNVEFLPGLCYVCRVNRILDDLEGQSNPSEWVGGRSVRKPEFIGWAPFSASQAPFDTRLRFYTAQSDVTFAEIVDIVASGGNIVAGGNLGVGGNLGASMSGHGDQGSGGIGTVIPTTDSWLEISSYAVDGVWDTATESAVLSQRTLCNTVRNGEFSFPDASSRNDIYVTLESGKFTQGKNVEVTMIVRNDDTGSFMNKCIQVGSVVYDGAYKTTIWPGVQSPTWRETVHLRIPPELLMRCHLYFQVRQVHKSKDKSSPILAFAFYHITNDDLSMTGEDPVTIDCYKHTGNVDLSPSQYLTGAGAGSGGGGSNALQQRKGESITLRFRSYTRIPKDKYIVDVLGLDGNLDRAGRALESLSYSATDESIQFLPAIIESLFKVLEYAIKRNVYNNTNNNSGGGGDGKMSSVTDELSMKCFKCLVNLMGTLMSERNKMYIFHKAALERFIEDEFKNTSIHNYLLPCIIEGIQVDKTQTVKTLPLILRFVIRSRMCELEAAGKTDYRSDTEFRDCLQVFFDTYFKITEENVGFRGNAVKTFDCILGIVEPFFTKEELCSLLGDFLDCQSRDDSNKNTDNINKSRLQLFARLFDGVLNSSLESIPLVMHSVAELVAQLPRASLGIMGQIIECFSLNIDNPKARELFPEIEFFYHYLLSFVLTEYEECAKRNAAAIKKAAVGSSSSSTSPSKSTVTTATTAAAKKTGENATVTEHQQLVSTYLAMLSIMLQLGVIPNMAEKEWHDGNDDDDDESSSEESSESASSGGEKKSSISGETTVSQGAAAKTKSSGNVQAGKCRFFREMLEVLRNVVCDKELYSDSWYFMNAFKDQVVSQVLCLFKEYYFPLVRYTQEEEEEDKAVVAQELEVWSLFITTAFEMLRAFRLVTNFDVFPDPEYARASFVDAEKLLIPILSEGWKGLGHKEQLVAVVVPYCFRLLNAATDRDPTSNEIYSSLLCELLVDVATQEHAKTGKIAQVSGVGCKVIDEIVRAKEVPMEVIQQFLGTRVKQAFDKAGGEPALKKLLATLTELLQLSVEFRDMPTGPEYEEERMVATMKMLDYFKGFDIGSYFHYVHSLYEENLKGEKKSYVEAANSIMLHANALRWSEKGVTKMEGTLIPMPAEPSWYRKVRLYEKAIDLYKTAEFWEEGFRLTRVLNNFHLKRSSYDELKTLTEKERELLGLMNTGTRKPYQYFFVSYVGNGFPSAIANKSYIYRGDSGDTADSVRSAILKRFRDAAPLESNAPIPANATAKTASKKYVVVAHVLPSSTEEIENRVREFPKTLPQSQRNHFLTSGTNVFAQRIMGHDGRRCVSKRYYFTAAPLPYITRSNEVVSKRDVPVPPIIAEMEMLDGDLEELNSEYQATKSALTDAKMASFSVTAKSAAVSTKDAFARYKNEFFGPESSDKVNQKRLYEAMQRLMTLLEDVYVFLNKECPGEFKDVLNTVGASVKSARESFDFITGVTKL